MLLSIVSLCALTGVSASAQAQAITSITVSPPTFSAAGQPLSFSIAFETTSDLKAFAITANSSDGSDAVNCPASAPISAGASFTCTANHVTTAADVSAGSVVETTSFTATTTLNQNDFGRQPYSDGDARGG